MYDYYEARQAGYPPPGIGVGGVFSLVFLILFGTATSTAYHHMDDVNWGQVREDIQIGDDDLGSWMGQKYEFNESKEQVFPANARLNVVCERGDIKVTTSSDDKMHVTINKLVYSSSQDEASKVSQGLAPEFKTEGSVVTIDASHSNGHSVGGSGRINLQIALPRKAAVDLMTLRGNVEVNGRDGDVKAHNSHGSVTVEDINGNAEVHLRNGDFVAQNVKGDVSVEGRVSDTKITDVSGTVSLQGDYLGSVQLSKVGKTVRFKSSRTDMEFARLDGDFNMEQGDLRANSLVGPFRLHTRSKDIHLEDISGDINVENENAEVELHPKSPLGNVTVANHKGSIRFVVPPNANYQVDAHSSHGSVENDFDMKVQEEHGDARTSGTIGKGGSRVELNNDRGEITIRKS